MTPPRWVVALFAVALAVSGLVALAVHFAYGPTYAQIARDAGFADTPSSMPPAEATQAAQPVHVGLAILLGWHEKWVAYVLGRSPDVPVSFGHLVFTWDETAHMTDVRQVFIAAQEAMYVARVVAIVLFGFTLRRGARTALVLLRDGALWAAAAVVVVAIVAAVAFEPAFLLFHRLFFPQGNFLFDPATSNLLRLYPEAYWYGVTMRIGIAFIAAAALIALAATAALRVRRSR